MGILTATDNNGNDPHERRRNGTIFLGNEIESGISGVTTLQQYANAVQAALATVVGSNDHSLHFNNAEIRAELTAGNETPERIELGYPVGKVGPVKTTGNANKLRIRLRLDDYHGNDKVAVTKLLIKIDDPREIENDGTRKFAMDVIFPESQDINGLAYISRAGVDVTSGISAGAAKDYLIAFKFLSRCA